MQALGVVLFLQLFSGATACGTVVESGSGEASAGPDCVFPFTYGGMSYSTCTDAYNSTHSTGAMWCYTDRLGILPDWQSGLNWENCDASCPSTPSTRQSSCTKTGAGWDDSCPSGSWVVSNSQSYGEHQLLIGQSSITPAQCIAAAQADGSCDIANLDYAQTSCWCQRGEPTCEFPRMWNSCKLSNDWKCETSGSGMTERTRCTKKIDGATGGTIFGVAGGVFALLVIGILIWKLELWKRCKRPKANQAAPAAV